MANSINGVTIQSTASSPTVNYTVAYTASRNPSSSDTVTYSFSGTVYLNSSGSVLGTGAGLKLEITVNGVTASTILKQDTDRWSGTARHEWSCSLSCSAASNQEQDVRFRVTRFGTFTGTAGTIDNSSYSVTAPTKTSSVTPTRVKAPTSVTAEPAYFRDKIVLSWSGAAEGEATKITGYNIRQRVKSSGTWGSWTQVERYECGNVTSGTREYTPDIDRGASIQYQVLTLSNRDANHDAEAYVSSNTCTKRIGVCSYYGVDSAKKEAFVFAADDDGILHDVLISSYDGDGNLLTI